MQLMTLWAVTLHLTVLCLSTIDASEISIRDKQLFFFGSRHAQPTYISTTIILLIISKGDPSTSSVEIFGIPNFYVVTDERTDGETDIIIRAGS